MLSVLHVIVNSFLKDNRENVLEHLRRGAEKIYKCASANTSLFI